MPTRPRALVIIALMTVAPMIVGCEKGSHGWFGTTVYEADNSSGETPTNTASTVRNNAPMQPVTIIKQITGSDAALKHPAVVLINDTAGLAATHSRELAKLAADFDTQSIILVAIGEQPTGGYWAHITGVQTEAGNVYCQATVNRPGPAQAVTTALSYPYAAVVVPKVEGALRAEIDSVQGKAMP
jgi:hypothetical protein